MTGPVQRTQYLNLNLGTVRTGATGHGESLTDVEGYVIPTDRAMAGSLFTWGVADGLAVRAAHGTGGVTVLPGVALDATGRLIVLRAGGVAVVDPDADPAQIQNVETVAVPADGFALPTPDTGDLLLTLTWREVESTGVLANAPVLLHAPWLRLVPFAGFVDSGDQVALARLTVDATGVVTALAAGPRRLAGLRAGVVQLRRPNPVAGPDLGVAQDTVAELAATDDGGVALTLAAGGPALRVSPGHVDVPVPLGVAALTVHSGAEIDGAVTVRGTLSIAESLTAGGSVQTEGDARTWSTSTGADDAWHLRDETAGADRLVVDTNGNVGIGVAPDAIHRPVHMEGGEIHSGAGGGYSFSDRANPAFVETPGTGGERWVWYAFQGSARLWSGVDLLSIHPTAEGGALDVPRRMRLRQGGDSSAGIWLFQDEAESDMAFIGMRDDFHVGFWGNTGIGWGMVMNTSDGEVEVTGALTVHGRISKLGGGFTIDHPLEPEKKLLSHSFVESPDMLNVYTGTTVTDAHARAVVALPDYFAALNCDARVQLTPVGALAMATVEGGIRDNAFTIRTDRPGVEVAWLVTGVRQDEWARENRIRVEEDKQEEQQ